VSIHDNVVQIIIGKHIVPAVAEVEGVLEDEVELRVGFSDEVSGVSVELHKGITRSVFPRLIDGFKSIDSWVMTPSLKKLANIVESPINVVLVDVVIAPCVSVEVTNPVGGLHFPVSEVVVINPLKTGGFTGVIKTILGIFKAVNIEKNLEAVFGGGIKEPLNLVLSTISAANVRSVWLESPVTDRKSHDLDFSLRHFLDKLFGNPRVPMCSEYLVTFLRSKLFAESVLIDTNTILLGVTKESVEKRRSNPRLKYLPATDVGTNGGSSFGHSSDSCKGE